MDEITYNDEQVQMISGNIYTKSINIESTLNQLQELASQYAQKGQLEEQRKEDFENISKNISELARQRKELHDLLEIETINANKRRRALEVLPKSFNLQIQDAVVSARRQNSDKIFSLQEKLKSLKEEVKSIQQQMEELTAENIRLNPECELTRRDHDRIIAQLNHRMSTKSSKQIALNETYDTLRDVTQQTADIDIGLENLAEDLKKDMDEAAEVKRGLLEETKKVEEQISSVKEKTTQVKKTLNLLIDQSTEKSVEIQEHRKTISRMENSVTRLEMDSLRLENRIDLERRENQKTVAEIDKFEKLKSQEAKIYEEKIVVLKKKVNQVLGEKEVAQEENDEIMKTKNEVTEQAGKTLFRKKTLLKEVKEIAKKYEALKSLTNQTIEEAGNIAQFNSTIEDQLKQLEENHRATVELYQTQSDELNEHLTKEMGERMKVEVHRNESEKHLGLFKAEETKFLNNISSRINSAAGEHQKLSERTLFLSRDTKKKKKQISTLEVKLEMAQGSFRKMKLNFGQDIERLKNNVEALKEDIETKKSLINEKVPILNDLKEMNEKLNEEYNESKNEMTSLRNQEKSLNEQKNRTKIMVEKIRKVVSELKVKLDISRKKALEQLKMAKEERDKLEDGINEVIDQLETIYKSNEHFKKVRHDICSDFDLLMDAMSAHAARQSSLLKQFKEIQKKLCNSWLVAVKMEKVSADHDANLLNDLHQIQKDTEERSNFLTKIAEKMEYDLSQLIGFVENVASRRPKDTRQSKRGESRKRSTSSPRANFELQTGQTLGSISTKLLVDKPPYNVRVGDEIRAEIASNVGVPKSDDFVENPLPSSKIMNQLASKIAQVV